MDAADLLDSHIASLYADQSGDPFDSDYFLKHKKRFLKTCEFIPPAHINSAALEVGSTAFFQVALTNTFGYPYVAGTHFSLDVEKKLYQRSFHIDGQTVTNKSMSIDIESDLLPYEEEKFDFILCCEVIEHLDVDPMFMMCEFNRVLKPSGKLLITTPNCCSARNFWKIAHGYRPHFFMQYERSRSPYRHNIEYDVKALLELTTAAGFDLLKIETHDVFEEPVPEALSFLKANELPVDHRGDDIFLLVTKTAPVRDRWPSNIYV